MKKCDQCSSLTINGRFCHEKSCPNVGARFDEGTQKWIKQYDCPFCGDKHDANTNCNGETTR